MYFQASSPASDASQRRRHTCFFHAVASLGVLGLNALLWGGHSSQERADSPGAAKPLAAFRLTAGPHTYTFDAKNSAKEPKITLNL